MKKKEIAILGVGFAGISTYLSLPKSLRKNHNITIINKENYFLFTPLIHELATGALNSYHVTESILIKRKFFAFNILPRLFFCKFLQK